ncbi:MAG: phosphoglycerate kinase [Heliobacteriaceae bacterium]|nr:phosphoglycerate kinase [Heliobacteriaceae bacterium]
MKKLTVRDVDVRGKRVLVRVDFNVPVDTAGMITDDTRIEAAMPTIRYLAGSGAKVVLVSHRGRPKGKVNEKDRLNPVAVRLGEFLGRQVPKLADCIGPEVEAVVNRMQPGDIVLLENVRFHPEEEKNDPVFAQKLAGLADLFVNDAFGAAHRSHASTVGVAAYIPAVAGLLLAQEITVMGQALTRPAKPFFAVLGGAKVADKIGVIENLISKTDSLLIGGGMANTFLFAQGKEVGKSLCEKDKADQARIVLKKAREAGVELLLPVDVVVATEPKVGATAKVVPVDAIPEDQMALDIGPESSRLFAEALAKARTVIWNGPMGAFELPPFDQGTLAIAQAVAAVNGVSIVGGGDSMVAVKKAGLTAKITHVSTGGGASLKFLEGCELPGVAVLQDKVLKDLK